jgi:fatty-acyl-CoA synthase
LKDGDPAYIQYSSGSTADPKGVLITQKALRANVERIIANGLELRETDRAFSWLPFYHDMGLVGFSIAPMFGLCDVDYISPSAFARRPRLWLELMSDNRSTITYAPTFGYRLAAQRYASGERPVNLSELRVAGIGGDMVRADVLDYFAKVTAETGFRPEAFLPSYGMAEAVLAVTFSDLETLPLIDQPRGMANRYVGCGRPLPDIDLLIVDESGNAMPEGGIGSIWLRGPSIIGAYLDNPEATRAIQRKDGFIDSGDLGYLARGQLVVTGRSKDLILHHGRNIWPQDVEWAAERVAPLKPGDVAAFGLTGDGEDRLVVLVQCRLIEEEARAALRQRVVLAISEAVGIPAKVVLIGPRDLPLTSSGKLSRSQAKALFLRTENADGHEAGFQYSEHRMTV